MVAILMVSIDKLVKSLYYTTKTNVTLCVSYIKKKKKSRSLGKDNHPNSHSHFLWLAWLDSWGLATARPASLPPREQLGLTET